MQESFFADIQRYDEAQDQGAPSSSYGADSTFYMARVGPGRRGWLVE